MSLVFEISQASLWVVKVKFDPKLFFFKMKNLGNKAPSGLYRMKYTSLSTIFLPLVASYVTVNVAALNVGRAALSQGEVLVLVGYFAKGFSPALPLGKEAVTLMV